MIAIIVTVIMVANYGSHFAGLLLLFAMIKGVILGLRLLKEHIGLSLFTVTSSVVGGVIGGLVIAGILAPVAVAATIIVQFILGVMVYLSAFAKMAQEAQAA